MRKDIDDKEILRIAGLVVNLVSEHTENVLEANSIFTAAKAAFLGGVGRVSDSTNPGETHQHPS